LTLPAKLRLSLAQGRLGRAGATEKATAVLLARQRAHVFATDINIDAANETRDIIEGEGGVCVAHQCDATAAEAVRAAVDACIQRFGRIDILVNNAGGSAAGDPVFNERRSVGRSARAQSENCFYGL
jgi:NAD(P)-dependent dehydrogenase (short-subunit alcohol dehydrogenase family)